MMIFLVVCMVKCDVGFLTCLYLQFFWATRVLWYIVASCFLDEVDHELKLLPLVSLLRMMMMMMMMIIMMMMVSYGHFPPKRI